MDRAQAGGQVGMNGMWYEGGQYLPNTQLGKTESSKRTAKVRKTEIEPYKWVENPDNKRSIYAIFAGTFGKVVNGKMVVNCSEQTMNYYKVTTEQVEEMAKRYNEGQRWM